MIQIDRAVCFDNHYEKVIKKIFELYGTCD